MRKSSLVAVLVVGALLVPLAVFASHSFNDVPDSHTFHNAIDWMKDNNITVGCNPPANTNFCPDDNVTRGQMSAFMKRLAENNVVDAATLDGSDGATYLAPVAATIGDGLSLANGVVVELAEVSIVAAEGGGGLVITSTLDPDGIVVGEATYWVQVDNASCNFNVANFYSLVNGRVQVGADAGNGTTASITGAAAVAGGPHTVTSCARAFSGGPIAAESSLVVEYVTHVDKTAGYDSVQAGDPAPGEPTS